MPGVNLEYASGELRLTGYVVGQEQASPRPGILILHGGAGLDAHGREQAHRYAGLGYVVLAADLFGRDGTATREGILATIATLRKDRDLLCERTSAAFETLRNLALCSGPVGLVGFCFGGMAALEFARSGAAVEAAVSIHGALSTNRPAAPGSVRASLLVCHGARDPHVPMADVTAFTTEMDQARARWELVMYGGAVHGFTHRDAVGPGVRPGVEYDEIADRRSFALAAAFLAETFETRVA